MKYQNNNLEINKAIELTSKVSAFLMMHDRTVISESELLGMFKSMIPRDLLEYSDVIMSSISEILTVYKIDHQLKIDCPYAIVKVLLISSLTSNVPICLSSLVDDFKSAFLLKDATKNLLGQYFKPLDIPVGSDDELNFNVRDQY